MKGLVKTAAVSLAAAGISSAVAASDRTIEGTAEVPQINRGTGLSFEDLRVGPMGKVAVGIGATRVPVRVAGDNCAPSPPPPHKPADSGC
jgi:hypothetical protein